MPTELKEYIKGFFVKVLENLSSVKVWFFILPFIVSTAILSVLVGAHIGLVKSSLTAIVAADMQENLVTILQEMKTIMDMFIAWCTFNVSLAGTVIVVREVFKVSKLKALNEEEKDNSIEIKKINV